MNKATHCIWIALTLATTSCIDDVDKSSDVKVRTQHIVINDFDVKQTRGQLYDAAQIPATDFARQAMLYRTAMESRAAVSIKKSKYVIENEKCTIVTTGNKDGEGYASGVLITDTRIMTAHHGIFQRVPETILTISFESDDGTSARYDGVEHEKPREERIPFLAKRLHSLGLRDWVPSKPDESDIRDKLRHDWNVELDTKKKDQDFVALNMNDHRGEGKDVAILRVTGNKLEELLTSDRLDSAYIRSGPFSITKPAVFFDRLDTTQFVEMNEPDCELDDKHPLYAYHANVWPDETVGAVKGEPRVSLISNPGYRSREKSLDHCNPDWEKKPVCFPDGEIGYIDYQGCLKTTLDIRRGSSGGGMSAGRLCRPNTCEGDGCPSGPVWKRPAQHERRVKGIIQGALYKLRDKETKEQAEGRVGSWFKDLDAPGGQTTLPTINGVETEMGHKTLEEAALITAVGSKLEDEWTHRDIDYSDEDDPDNPWAHQPDDGLVETKLKCLEFDSQERCTRYETTRAYSPVFPSQSTPPGGGSGGGTTSDDEKDIKKTVFQNPQPPGKDEKSRAWFHECMYNVPDAYKNAVAEDLQVDQVRIPRGMMIGIMGSASHTSIPNDGQTIASVRDFMGVCVPWSSASWFDNWAFAYVRGVRQRFTSQRTAYFPGYWMTLYKALRQSYEVRTEKDAALKPVARLRPPSMITCPPNYYLKGLTFSHGLQNGKDSPTLLGVTALHCERIEASYDRILQSSEDGYGMMWKDKMPYTLTVPTQAPPNTNFKLSGESFSMDAHIGSPVLQTVSEGWSAMGEEKLTCQDVEIDGKMYAQTVVGFQITQHTDNTLDQLSLYCGLAPGVNVAAP